jgi:Zn-dependent protease
VADGVAGAARGATTPFVGGADKTEPSAPGAAACAGCATQLAPALLACPSCGTLVHAADLARLAAAADEADRRGDLPAAAAAWRDAIELLPDRAPQHAAVAARLDDVTRRIDAAPRLKPATAPAADGSWLKRGWGAISAALVVLLSKAKLLLLGLTKAKTLLSMLAFVGVYFRLYGWPLAAGFVVSIYIHEMGHVAALARYGIRAGAPMFIPGLGAFVRLKQAPLNAREDARIGLAGPEWGLAAAAIAFAVFLVTRVPVWGAIAGLGAYLNLFNLLPFWQLDGARGFRALSRQQRWMAAGATAVAGLLATQPLLYVVAAVGAFRAWRSPEEAADRRAFVTYVALVALLTAIVAATASVAHR